MVLKYISYATEVSAEGNNSVELPVMGFGGEIKGLNACDIESAGLGNIDLGKFTFNVMDALHTSKGKKIEAIIGLDIISKAECYYEYSRGECNCKGIFRKK